MYIQRRENFRTKYIYGPHSMEQRENKFQQGRYLARIKRVEEKKN